MEAVFSFGAVTMVVTGGSLSSAAQMEFMAGNLGNNAGSHATSSDSMTQAHGSSFDSDARTLHGTSEQATL